MKLDAPASSVSGVVRAEFTTNDRALEYTLADLAGYSPSDPAAADATLTVRDGPFGATTTIPRPVAAPRKQRRLDRGRVRAGACS